jgi:hypothetical protein
MEVYRQLFKEAEPSADIDHLIQSNETKTPNWFEAYYLSQDRQIEILEEIAKKHRLSKREKYMISKEVNLGCSPTTVKKPARITTSKFPDSTPSPRGINKKLYKNWTRMTERIEEHLENPTEFQYLVFKGTAEDFDAWYSTG